jgi:hypothetical protein
VEKPQVPVVSLKDRDSHAAYSSPKGAEESKKRVAERREGLATSAAAAGDIASSKVRFDAAVVLDPSSELPGEVILWTRPSAFEITDVHDNLLCTWPYSTLKRWTPKKTGLSITVNFGDCSKIYAFSVDEPEVVSGMILHFCGLLASQSSALVAAGGGLLPSADRRRSSGSISRDRGTSSSESGFSSASGPIGGFGEVIGGYWLKQRGPGAHGTIYFKNILTDEDVKELPQMTRYSLHFQGTSRLGMELLSTVELNEAVFKYATAESVYIMQRHHAQHLHLISIFYFSLLAHTRNRIPRYSAGDRGAGAG